MTKTPEMMAAEYALNNLKTELNWAMFYLNRNNTASAKSYVQLVQESLEDVVAGFTAAQKEIEKLQAFKDFVHRRLNEMGIPTNPDGEHSKAGCRIGDRLDIVEWTIRDNEPILPITKQPKSES